MGKTFTLLSSPLAQRRFSLPPQNSFEDVFLDLLTMGPGGSPLCVYYQVAMGKDGLLVRSEDFAQAALNSISDYCPADLPGSSNPQPVMRPPVLQHVENEIFRLDLIASLIHAQELPPLAEALRLRKPASLFIHSPSTSCGLSRAAFLRRIDLSAPAFAPGIRVSCGGACFVVEMSAS